MNDYTGYDYIDMIDYSRKKIFENQMKYEGTNIVVNGSDTIEAIIRNESQELSESKEFRTVIIGVDVNLQRGDYVRYDNENYMVLSDVDNYKWYKKTQMRKCNQMFVMYDSTNTRHEFPCIVSNDSYGSKSIADNDYITNEDSKASIVIQSNVYTRQIPKNYRVMFCNSKEGIYKIFSINVAIKDGVIDFIGKKDLYLSGLDNLENNTAYQYSYMDSEEEESIDYPLNKLCGDDNIIIGNQSQYVYITSNNERVSWSLDNTVCTMAQQGSNYCTLEALKADNVCVLTARINNVVVGEKFITTSRY